MDGRAGNGAGQRQRGRLAPVSAISPGEAYRNKLRAAGITPDKPLFEVLDGAHEDRQAIRAALERMREPAPPEAIKEVAKSISSAVRWRLAQAYPWAVGG